MFSKIFRFELQYRWKRPATWAYFGILLLFGFILAANAADGGSEKSFANSAVSVVNLLTSVSIFTVLIASAVMGVPVYRDIEHGVKDYFFTYPVSEWEYLLGRYLGSFVTLLFISLGLLAGMLIGYGLGPVLGWVEAERFGPLRFGDYVYGTLVFLWPNLLLTGTVFFCLVALTRKIFVSYVGSILFFVAYLVAVTLASDLDNQSLVAVLDPFGLFALEENTKYLTPVERNTSLVPLTGNLLINRLLWTGLALALLVFTLFRFSFVRVLGGARARVKAAVAEARPSAVGAGGPAGAVALPGVRRSFATGQHLRQMASQAWIEFQSILRDPYFIGIISGALLFLFFDGWFSNLNFGTRNLPTTYYMLEMKNATYLIFVMVILVFYTGEVVHRDRTVKFDQISDALPVPNWVIYGGKLLTMFLVTFLLVTMVWVIGVFSQTIQGYFNYEFGMYFKDLYLLTWPQYLVLMSLAFFVHVLVNKKFTGHVVAIGLYAAIFFTPTVLDLDYNMLIFGSRPDYVVSDMNGFGHFLPAISWFNAYWLAFGTVLIVLGLLFFARGADNHWRSRVRRFGNAWNWRPAAAIAAALGVFALSGFTIYSNVSVSNDYRNRDDALQLQADYENTYSHYATMEQPKITTVDYRIDLYPERRAYRAHADFTIQNKTAAPIDTLFLNHNVSQKEQTVTTFLIGNREPELLNFDAECNLAFYLLADPLRPGESRPMAMTLEGAYRGFPNEGLQREVVYNGTFLNNRIFPGFGYDPGEEISSDLERRKHGLEIKDYQLPPATDERGRNNLLFGDDAEFVSFRAVVSTAPDQIAVAPGRLVRERKEAGRRYFEYANEGKIQNFFNISSARYTVDEDVWENPDGRDVRVQLFRHSGHGRNVDRYIDGVKASLAYFSKNFSPYQFDQLRILEFPRYADFAQSFPNTVPYAESFGWIGDFSDPDDTDYVFTVTSHEVAHQWWGHQVAPSATRGANQISETMAQYSSLMVTKERYGEAAMQPTLKYELDAYLRGRAGENNFEKTLLDNDDQPYVWYRKGALVTYALQDYIGEDRLNAGFARFLDSFGLKETPPFATSLDWFGYIDAVTPDSMKYFLNESFREITLYENRALSATSADNGDGTHTVTLRVDTRKIKYDGNGNELDRPGERSLIEIGIFGEDGKSSVGKTEKTPLYLKKHWLVPGEHTIELTVRRVPLEAGIDPYNKLIDRVSDDNLVAVE